MALALDGVERRRASGIALLLALPVDARDSLPHAGLLPPVLDDSEEIPKSLLCASLSYVIVERPLAISSMSQERSAAWRRGQKPRRRTFMRPHNTLNSSLLNSNFFIREIVMSSFSTNRVAADGDAVEVRHRVEEVERHAGT